MSSSRRTYAAWFRRDGALVAETFEAESPEEAQRIANSEFGTGQFAPLTEVIEEARSLGQSFDWAKLRALPLTDSEAAALSFEDKRRYVLIVNDHARGEALTVSVSAHPIRIARAIWREFGDPECKPDTLGECIADVLGNCEAGVWYSIPLGDVHGVVFAADQMPPIDQLAEGLKVSVPALHHSLFQTASRERTEPKRAFAAIVGDLDQAGREWEGGEIEDRVYAERRASLLEEASEAPDLSPNGAALVAALARNPFFPMVEPAYTVVGTYQGRGRIRKVNTSEGPEAAVDLAQDHWGEQLSIPLTEKVTIVAVFDGEPKLAALSDGLVRCARCGRPGCDPELERRPGEGVLCDECRDDEEEPDR